MTKSNKNEVLDLTQKLAALCQACEVISCFDLESYEGDENLIIQNAGLTKWWEEYQGKQNKIFEEEKKQILKKLTPQERKILGY